MNKKSRTRAKRATRIRLTLVYTLMIVSVVLLVSVLYLFIQGYRFNRYEGQLQQGGLVQFDSVPGNASIWLDGSQLGIHTQGNLTIAAGNHTIGMRKEGYYDWNKDVSVKPGNVLWLDYIRFVPKELSIDSPVSFKSVLSSAVSSDNKKIAVIENAALPALSVVNMDNNTPKRVLLAIQNGSYTVPAADESQAFEVVAWAHDSRYVLLKHTYGSNTEWLSVDTEDANTVKNVTTSLGVDATTVAYSEDDANTVFILDTSNAVRRANLDQKTLSGPLLQDVESFRVYDGSTLTYVTKPDAATAKRMVAYLTLGAKKPRIVAKYDSAGSGNVRFIIGSYDGARYLAVANGETVRILTGDLSASDAERPAAFTEYGTFTVAGGVKFLGLSPDRERFVYAQNDNTVSTFDLDARMVGKRDFASAQSEEIQWLDKYHFTAVENGGLTMYDFDGTNGYVLATRALTNVAALNQNGRYLYTLRSTESGSVQLSRVKMILN